MALINIVIPVYNEEKRITSTLKAYKTFSVDLAKQRPDLSLMLYIVNDGSTDGTLALTRTLLKDLGLRAQIMDYTSNKGKGYAVKYGILNSSPADYYYLADADLSSGWDVLLKLLEVAEVQNADCVIGSRHIAGAEVTTSGGKKYSGRIANLLVNLFLDLGLEDTQCGYKLFRSSCLAAFEQQKIERWGFDFEILYILKLQKFKTVEVGITWENREGSKVKASDYIKTLQQLWQVRRTHKY